MKKKFRMAIVGCGDISRYMALACKLNRHVEMISCVAAEEDRVARFARKHKIPHSCTDYEEVFSEQVCDFGELDAVYLAVPHHLHYPMILRAIEQGVHVFCEKPITISLEEALDVCSRAREKGIKVGVNYQYRYDKGCYALARAAQKGDLGTLFYSRCNIPWHREEDYFSEGEWRRKIKTSGGGTLITQGSHALDIALWALGGKPVAARGIRASHRFKEVEVEDTCMGIVEMENGASVQISSSMAAHKEMPVSIELYGSDATALYKGFDLSRVRFKGKRIRKEKPGIRGLHALFRALEGFRRWVLFDEPYLVPVEESVPVLAAVSAIYRSAETGKREEVDQRYREFLGE
ncbi:MAG: Gfo/Idh/MocA family oxidoreductase [bacterium]|nr:Gfo/Idh/MocA family oxidoreductase [bacterium]